MCYAISLIWSFWQRKQMCVDIFHTFFKIANIHCRQRFTLIIRNKNETVMASRLQWLHGSLEKQPNYIHCNSLQLTKYFAVNRHLPVFNTCILTELIYLAFFPQNLRRFVCSVIPDTTNTASTTLPPPRTVWRESINGTAVWSPEYTPMVRN